MEQHTTSANDRGFERKLFYWLVGIASGLGLLLAFYYSLRMNSSVSTLISTTAHAPIYLFTYAILTIATVIAFGIHASLFTYQWRRFGAPKIEGGASSLIGGIIGIFASACPSCGSILLSAIGITSGLLAFPLEGLELKALSFLFVAVPLFFLIKRIRKEEAACANGTCPEAKDDSFKDGDKKWVAILAIASIIMTIMLFDFARLELGYTSAVSGVATKTVPASPEANKLFAEMTEQVIPKTGFQSKIVLHDAVLQLVSAGVIDVAKTSALYGANGIPDTFMKIITKADDTPIVLTQANAPYYLNALWGLGLANHMEANRASPVAGKDLFNFASTGGWTLGKADNGGEYFNKFPIVKLTAEQEALVQSVAENSYRPCCDNSSFFQDCNHGSALLGLLELGAKQGLTEAELYNEALHWNSFWFPQQYIEAAMYFKSVNSIDWKDIDPKLVMSKFYSSASGWYKNIFQPLKDKGLIPDGQVGGTGC